MAEDESFSCASPRLSLLSNPWEVEAESEEAEGIKTPPLIPPHSIAIPFKWEEFPGKPIQSNSQALTLTHSTSLHLPPRLHPLSHSMRRSSSLSSSSAPLPLPPPPLCPMPQWTPSTSPHLPSSLSFTTPAPNLGKKGILIKMRRTSALFAAILNRIRISLKKGR